MVPVHVVVPMLKNPGGMIADQVPELSILFTALLGKPCPAGRPAGRRSSQTVVGCAGVVSSAEKKAFDRGSPVWPPRSNAANEHFKI